MDTVAHYYVTIEFPFNEMYLLSISLQNTSSLISMSARQTKSYLEKYNFGGNRGLKKHVEQDFDLLFRCFT